ncbi:hypothetical protein ACISOH_05555, partial [Campylobacter jejuni]
MTINSANPYQNLTLSNPLQNSSALNLIKDSKALDQKGNENSLEQLSYIFNNITYASEFGFRINEEGFFDKDLNKIANIPESYDINIKSVRSIAKELAKQDENLNYNKIDLPYLLNSYHSSLKSINSEFLQDDNAYLSRYLISKLSSGFSIDNGEFLGQISRIYNNQEEIYLALSNTTTLNTLMLVINITIFNLHKFIINTYYKSILNK